MRDRALVDDNSNQEVEAKSKPSQKDLIIEAVEQRLDDYESARSAGVYVHQVGLSKGLLEDVIKLLKGEEL
jgi:hypothetical protein